LLPIKIIRLVGNDTIDPYPLIPEKAEKILRITAAISLKINRSFKDFRAFIQGPVCCEKASLRPQRSKLALLKERYQRDYEPTNAIYVNECDFRRWCRVGEWFKEFGPDAQKTTIKSLDLIKMDT
jgi:hypothetical protein